MKRIFYLLPFVVISMCSAKVDDTVLFKEIETMVSNFKEKAVKVQAMTSAKEAENALDDLDDTLDAIEEKVDALGEKSKYYAQAKSLLEQAADAYDKAEEKVEKLP